jgi:imidazolonepropionase-like amidohydrolase
VVLPEGVERDVFVTAEGRFTFRSDGDDARTVLDDGYLLPGLADVHAHLAMSSPAGDDAPDLDRTTASARAQLENGVLAIREPGAPNRLASTLRIGDGFPRIQSAGHWLAAPGRFLEGLAREVDPELLPEAAAEEAQACGWAKVIGDWRLVEKVGPSFHADQIARAAALVHQTGGRLAVHATVRETIDMAVASGCDSIEHGTELEPAHVEAMVTNGIALVPTMGAVSSSPPPDAPSHVKARTEEWARRLPGRVRMAWEAGVVVLAGTDAALPHGLIRDEVRMLAAAGLTPQAAIGAASWDARRFLGLPGIEEGAPADLVAFVADPRERLDELAHPALIILDGTLIHPLA